MAETKKVSSVPATNSSLASYLLALTPDGGIGKVELGEESGAGFLPIFSDVNDADSATRTGFYRTGASCLNVPSKTPQAGVGFLLVLNYDGQAIIQIWFSWNAPVSMSIRRHSSTGDVSKNKWEDWLDIQTVEHS